MFCYGGLLFAHPQRVFYAPPVREPEPEAKPWSVVDSVGETSPVAIASIFFFLSLGLAQKRVRNFSLRLRSRTKKPSPISAPCALAPPLGARHKLPHCAVFIPLRA